MFFCLAAFILRLILKLVWSTHYRYHILHSFQIDHVLLGVFFQKELGDAAFNVIHNLLSSGTGRIIRLNSSQISVQAVETIPVDDKRNATYTDFQNLFHN